MASPCKAVAASIAAPLVAMHHDAMHRAISAMRLVDLAIQPDRGIHVRRGMAVQRTADRREVGGAHQSAIANDRVVSPDRRMD